ncbi:MAG: hypothetical protein ABIR24_08200 [Verrucomicrobiota bacterium]
MTFIEKMFPKLAGQQTYPLQKSDWVKPRLSGFTAVLFILIQFLPGTSLAVVNLPTNLPGEWSSFGRATIQTNTNSVVILGGFVATKQTWRDSEMTVRMRTPAGTGQVQLWGGFRFRDRDSRYVFALRGGENNDVYLARYAPAT